MNLIEYQNSLIAQDALEALEKLHQKVQETSAELNVELPPRESFEWGDLETNPGPTNLSPAYSAIPTGREVYLRLDVSKISSKEDVLGQRERGLALLWALALPLGFTPYTRYPVPGPQSHVFHYFGPWHILMDHFLGSGRGEAAWPSFCCAAQAEAETWKGGRATERRVQAHLHRLGFNVGVIDGVVGPRTQGGLKAVGLHSLPLTDILERLEKRSPDPAPTLEKPLQGVVYMPEVTWTINTYGQVRMTKTVQGATLNIQGPGRVVVDVQETTSR